MGRIKVQQNDILYKAKPFRDEIGNVMWIIACPLAMEEALSFDTHCTELDRWVQVHEVLQVLSIR